MTLHFNHMWVRRSPGQPQDATYYKGRVVKAWPRASADLVKVDPTDGVTMEPLRYGDRVIVKTGQSTAIKIDIMEEWGKPLWPIDMTSIPLGEVSRIVPSLVGQVFFEDPIDSYTYDNTGAEVELIVECGYGPDNDDPPIDVLRDLEVVFPDGVVITPKTLCSRANLVKAFFAKHSACQIMFTPAAACRPINDPRVDIFNPYAECSFVLSGARGTHAFTFEPPYPINVYVFNPSMWSQLGSDDILHITIPYDTKNNEAMQEWASLDIPSSKAGVMSNMSRVRHFFGRWPHVSVSMSSPGLDIMEIAGPVCGQCRILAPFGNTAFGLLAFDNDGHS